MSVFIWLCIFIVIFIISFFLFAYLYYKVDDPVYINFTDGLYISSQVCTTVGMSEIPENASIRTLIIIQSFISLIINIMLVIFISKVISAHFKSNGTVSIL